MEEIISFIKSTIGQFQILDLVDILIATILIYQLVILTRGTRAVQVMKGVGIIVVASRISSLLRLASLTWILNYLIGAGAIVLVILFQSELRRALEQIGRNRWFNKSSLLDKPLLVAEEVCDALISLSKRKVGALIIIENHTMLNDYAQNGTLLDARISSGLIQNIFEPNTPLHDGAVIIRKDRIVAAGCFLPLSENQAISRALGTRHRAAMGISEVSDSVTFVVSEETANISVAQDGKLTRNLDELTIMKLLKMLYHIEPKEAPFKWKWRAGK
ncbi:MAG: diadenylate cyclase CdaA [Christensenellales bacterium]